MCIRSWTFGLVLASCVSVLHSGDLTLPERNPFGLPEKAIKSGGTLIMAGGGNLTDEIYDEFVRLAGGEDAKLVLIPSAYPYRDQDHIERAFGGWSDYEVASFDFLHTDEADEADTPDFCKVLETATGVWIAGGAQGRLVDRYCGTRVETLLRRVLERGGVIGGTSAGASVQSKIMIRYGSATEAVLDSGLALTSQLVIDQHFSQRGRFPRLLNVLEDHPDQIGVGLDEDTAVIIRGNRIRILGDGRATVCFGLTGDNGGVVLYRLSDREEAQVSVEARHSGRSFRLTRLETARLSK